MSDEPDQVNPLDQALFAIADGAPIPWQRIQSTLDSAAQLDVLRLLNDVAQAYRAEASPTPAASRDLLFRWGSLEVESMLGEGSYGEVYRAFDPWLGRHVALKLLRNIGNVDGGLEEARHLARLRHRNVLSVYGCAINDGRAGLWSELIHGRTLAASVSDDGGFAPSEVLRIGHEMAQALAAVHATGLVHGDVKAENVMRESGGRIVLMDFGAGGDERLLASQRLISGTPRYLPPEVLDGAPLSMASDIYALGVLLFFLLAGRHPYAQSDAAQLREAQRRGSRLSLHALRPELDPALCALIERCLALDPAQRPVAAAPLAAQFAELLRAPMHAAMPPSRRSSGILLVALGALLAAVALLAWPRFFPPIWETQVKFLRVESSGNVELAASSTLSVGDHLRMTLQSTRDAYVYVLNEDAAGDAIVLFPPSSAQDQHAQPHGATLQLPGDDAGALAWEVTADSAREEFIVVTSLQPLPTLESRLASWKHAENATSTRTRAVGAIVSTPAPLLRGEHLRELIANVGNDTEHVRIWQFSFAHQPR